MRKIVPIIVYFSSQTGRVSEGQPGIVLRMKSLRHEGTGAVAAGLLFVAATGCVNARDEFTDYGNRVIDAAPPVDAPIVSTIPDPTGEWLITARPNLSQKTFLNLRGTFTYTPITENTGELDYTVTALNYQTLEPVGDPFIGEDRPVGQDASFSVPLVGTLAGEANPITNSPIALNAELHGTVITADFLCGMATGDASGLNLEGTTWAAVRITGDELPEAKWRCDQGPTGE